MYKNILQQSVFYTTDNSKIKYLVKTIDSDLSKKPDYYNINNCIDEEVYFDLSLICCPNYLHEYYVEKLYPISNIVLVEKPGLKDLTTWERYYSYKQNIFLVKNNMWRSELKNIKTYLWDMEKEISSVDICWLNKDRIPSPGTWFTNKELAFGGVSRDLLPHLLSIYYSLFDNTSEVDELYYRQFWDLSKITNTDYGIIHKDGVYDVDDYCQLLFNNVSLTASWRTPELDDNKIGIEVKLNTNKPKFFEFGLCPEYCYKNMIDYFLNLNESEKQEQYKIDCWIHHILQKI